MRKIIYYVAISVDGFICGEDEDISGFVQTGNGVERYLNDLKDFDTVIMGRKTYEFGYKFGLVPGKPAYPHMLHFIFSNSLVLNNPDENVKVKRLELQIVNELKAQKGKDIYLCGGGDFAGWLLNNQVIDILKIKLNPLVLNKGVRLFGNSTKQYGLSLLETESFEQGLQIITYKIDY